MASVAELRKQLLPDGQPHHKEFWDNLVDALDRDLAIIKVALQ